MSVRRTFFAFAILLVVIAGLPAAAQPAGRVTAVPAYVPDYSHAGDKLPDGVLAWNKTTDTVMATNGQDFARFLFSFTNIAVKMDLGQATNFAFTTNYTIVTNTGFWSVFSGRKYTDLATVVRHTNVVTVTNSITPIPVTIINVHPSCGCTTAELPPVPWFLPPGTNSFMKVNVNLAAKSGTVYKSVAVTTDKGKIDLGLVINIQAPPIQAPLPAAAMSEAERARGIAAAKIDRQAVFHGDCVTCHAKNVQGKFGPQLFTEVCAVCHEAKPRATMVPDLHNLKDPTNEEFWRAWIAAGKAGTLMPAFAISQGGPLNDAQIASLAVFLNQFIPPRAPQPAAAR